MSPLSRLIESLLFLSADPVSREDLARATGASEALVSAALDELAAALDGHGIVLRELAGGWVLASDPAAEPAARELLARPRSSSAA